MSALAAAVDEPRFALPAALIATAPPEARGIARDAVRLMVVDGRVRHMRFSDIGTVLQPGDLLVVNTSMTVAAAFDALWRGGAVVVHVAARFGESRWLIEIRSPDQSGPVLDAQAGEEIVAANGLSMSLEMAHAPTRRLWRAAVRSDLPASRWMQRYARPISYSNSRTLWPLRSYQTVFAREPGSAEMPSAARPFTAELVTALVGRGVSIAPLVLHTAVSSMETGETPLPEHYRVPPATAHMVNSTRAAGGAVIAVGTTVARALETVAREDRTVSAGSGWTGLMLSASHPARAIDGLITGWHEPESTHLQLLESVIDAPTIDRAYAAALDEGYLWHEFGDSCMFVAQPA